MTIGLAYHAKPGAVGVVSPVTSVIVQFPGQKLKMTKIVGLVSLEYRFPKVGSNYALGDHRTNAVFGPDLHLSAYRGAQTP